ncbi:ATP-binding protein [Lutimonas halocynthiae]|uniref:ATP-binding protein n=1 Tax=Lutimonas halocynthiae TaxID=1446477 RepID=UPI0025B40885|nr:ATP-binding protein [Lutimonas halocynthiae]MDN3642879.1 ATP-binding protein [Lutimonas halocynthiae]
MNLSKQAEKELLVVYNSWWESYLNGDIPTYDSFLDDDFRFVGSTDGEEFLNRKGSTAFFEATADQLAGKAKLENIVRTIESIDSMVLITDLADAYVLDGNDWVYYARFRFTSLMRNTSNGWRFFYQHFSTPDVKAEEGETLGIDKITSENLELRNAIKRRTAELEIKNRDLEVEASLERIRAQVTAMSQSSDLLDIVVSMRTEFVNLGHEAHYFWQMSWLTDRYQKAMTSGDGTRIGMIMELPRDFHSHYEGMTEWENNDEPIIVLALETEIAVDYIDKMIKQGNFQLVDPNAPSLDDVRHIGGLTFVSARTAHGEIGYSLPGVVKNPPKEDLDILVRFAGAFDLAHKRFEDLRRSEQQARETKIELGLERVRARAMAMQDSSELSQLVDTVFKELAILDFALQACIINLIDIDNLCNTVWMKSPDVGSIPDSYFMKFEDYPFHDAMKEGYLRRKAKYIYTIQGAEKKEYDKYLFKDTAFRKIAQEAQDSFTSLEKYVCSFTFSNFGGIQTIGEEPLSDENLDILARFGKVFDLTYTRFNDLKLAEAQARESRIELSLERVRARTMAMQQSEELGDVATVLFKELNELVENLWTCGFVLCEKDRKEDEWWLSTEEGFIPPLLLPNVGDDTHHNIYEAWKNGATYHTEQLEGEALQEHYDWLLNIPAAKEVFDDMQASGQKKPTWQKLHCAYFSYGYLVMITEVPCPEEEIFKRFAKVFDQTYTRFLDLQKSEAQAREAEVELALERVRARTMAMQHSEELAEVATVLFQQVGELGIPQWTCGFNIWETGDTHFTFYPGGPDGEILASCKVPLMEHPIFRQFDESKKRGDELLVYEKEGEIQADHYRYMHSLPGIGDMLQGMLDSGLEFPTYQIDHVANFLYGNIIFITYEPFPEMHDVFKRFAKVFEQTYTRFLDLQKAEAQAKEAQIEAALERIRSKSMSMISSKGIGDTVATLFHELVKIGHSKTARTGIGIFDDSKYIKLWSAIIDQDEEAVLRTGQFDMTLNPSNIKVKNAWESGVKDYYFEMKGPELIEYYKTINESTSYDLEIDLKKLPEKEYWYQSYFKYGLFYAIDGVEISEETKIIFTRFSQVFEQVYTRFLDLQKAENQAREGQIETALERVRSRSIGMQNSEELKEVIQVIFDQLSLLNINAEHAGIVVDYKEKEDWNFWVAETQDIPSRITVPYLDSVWDRQFTEAKKKGKDFFTTQLDFEEKNKFYEKMLPYITGLTKKARDFYLTCPGLAASTVVQDNIGLYIENFDGTPYSKEENSVLRRFGMVFQQTYTRFLDLQKAEAQARESQIEAALEKVRSQSLAMHKSEQLPETSKVLFEQFESLGKVPDRIGIIIFNEEAKEFELWGTDQIGSELNHSFVGSLEEPTVMIKMHKAWKEGKDSNIIDLSGHDLKDWIKYNRKNVKLPVDVSRIKGRRVQQAAFFSQGMFLFTSNEPEGEETMSLLVRFAKVFDQAYTRFLDLQKAEAQAREAQIEAALEKIRSRTMAMQKGEELHDVVVLLYKELITLGVTNFATCGYVEINEKTQLQSTWVTSPGGDSLGLFYLPLTGDVHFDARYAAWKKQQTVFHQTVAGKERKKHLAYAITTFNSKEAEEMVLNQFPDPTVFYCFNFSHGYLHVVAGSIFTKEEETLLTRFTRVFEQTYARFLDLKKAEAQAREAQIETALERVRSRTMAMHNSSELAETAAVLFQQLKELGVDHDRTNIGIVDEVNGKINFWLTTQKGNLVDKIFPASIDESNTLKTIYKGYKEKRKSIIVEQKGAELKRWISFITDKLGIPYIPPTRNEVRVQNVGYISQGMLIATSTNPLNEESIRILERFAAVFEQTYTRFLDLQKAEAQAREAQIEAALEKVRSRSLAMQKPEELQEVVAVVAEKLKELGVIFDAGGVILCTYFPDNKDVMHWIAVDDFSSSGSYFVPYFDNPIFNDAWDSKIKGDAYFSKEFSVKAKNEFFKHAFKNSDYRYFPDDYKQHVLQADKHNLSAAWSKNSAIIIPSLTGAIPSESDAEIMKRFAKVFEQAYIRFMDLQKAEAQAREAQIEAALERTRNQSMQMQHSDEIKDLSKIFHEQLHVLNIPSEFSYVWLPEEAKQEHMFWATWSETTKGATATRSKSVVYPLDKSEPYTAACYKAWISKEPVHESKILAKDTEKFFDIWKELLKGAKKLKVRYFPEGIYYAEAYMKYGCFGINIRRALQNDEADILHRFAIEFERAYTRFLDLKRAEEQAREAQIEGALERVRSKTMAMHNSQEVGATIGAMFDELVKLGIEKSVRCGIGILDRTKPMELWTASSNTDGEVILSIGFLDMSIHPLLKGVKKSWEKKEANFKYELKGKNLLKYFTALNESPEYLFQTDLESLPKKVIHNSFPFSEGTLFAFSPHPLTKEEEQIFKRFTGVFAQTYTRYLDLLKAEAQTREVQIEAALERVRSKTMAMHNSEEVGQTVISFFDEVMKLGLDKTIRCGIGILENGPDMETWSANLTDDDEVVLRVGLLNMQIHPMLQGLRKAWDNGKEGYTYDFIGKDVYTYYNALNNEPEYPFNADLDALPENEYHHSFFFSSGIIFAFSENRISEEACKVLDRFSDVFGQTYRRYLDLRKAEAQAKEAQIEAALEKVRSRTMAMQASSELQEASHLLFLEVRALGIDAWSAGYNILNEDKTQSECWMSSLEELQDPFSLSYTEEASFIEMGTFLKSEEEFLVQELAGKDLEQHYAYMKSLPELKQTFKQLEDAGLSVPTHQVNHLCKFSKGYLLFITYESVPKEHDIFKRFTKVFEQTYTRFLDLKKAENQSKEAQIELALERVRASSMAMHKSEQLAETAEVLFEQFDLLGIIPDRISIAIYNEKKRLFELWSTDQSGTLVNHGHDFSIEEPTCMAKTYKAWKEGKETFTIDLKGKDLEDWVRYVKEEAKMALDDSEFQGRRVQHAAFFSQGYLLLSSHLPISDETEQLLVRFTKVFQQTYTRFLDLQKAEKQVRETIKRASVDRVRAEIASMRTGTDLNRITPLIWNELTTLDVPFIRCGVFIMDEETQQVQTHLSTPDGKAIASFELPFENTAPLEDLVLYWRKNEMYKDYWDESAFIKSINTLMQRGKIESAETYMTKNQPTCLHLHFLPFLQGMLYVGSEVSLTKDELSLLQNLAEAFSSAYARYEDFNKLELANIKIEKTLVDLKQAQSQLVQSEKMASLGELTAGIAHEIQNPLNFVNNFSEVSQELMEEMHEEIKNGDLEEALEIGNDIEQNLEKIHHHGQRASEIVKGMLQHSRSSSGVRELTDINALADEYLRLAYHGLRAKDKTFNATMETHFDEKLTKIEVIPQDIGRVILNLITNAFYAVDQKKKQEIDGYEPKVTIHTKRTKKGNEIKVTDNGNGIPQKVLDKIFQPFFTTKPTGQGTGLGLSLSYDIITAHRGELKVETKEGVGTTFIIQLTTL